MLRKLAVFGLALGASWAIVPPAGAASGGSILVIMDVSGSMARKDASGTVLIDGARTAISSLLKRLPDDVNVGLRLYGHSYAGQDEATGCKDTELVVPIGAASDTASDIQAAIDAAKPTGFTPIGGSLAAAAKDFAPEGQRSVILVSDGEDTCNTPEPCAAARALNRQDVKVRVDTIGLFLEGNREAKEQLTCIAQETGGSFYDVADADQLGARLGAVGTRAVKGFDVDGQKIEGGPSDTEATLIEVDKEYSDDVRQGESRWYRFRVPAGMIPTTEVTEDGSVDYGCCMFTRLYDPDHEKVGSENDFNNSGSAETYRVKANSSFETDGEYFLQVSIDEKLTSGDMTGPLPYEVRVSLAADPSATPTPAADGAQAASDESPVDESGNGLLWALIGVLSIAVLGLGAAVIALFRRQQQS